MNKIKVLIIDDEPIARNGLKEYIEDISFVEFVAEAEHPLKANDILKTTAIDLILCDIQMPRMTGLEFIKLLKQPPMVVFTTAYPEFALQGYELDVVDYLVKPISFERFYKAMQKVQELLNLKLASTQNKVVAITEVVSTDNEYCFIKNDQQLEKIWLKDILFIEAMQNYVSIQLVGNVKKLCYITLSNIEEALPIHLFIKIHKSYIIAIHKVEKLSAETLTIQQFELPISRSLKDVVHEQIVNNKLIKRQ